MRDIAPPEKSNKEQHHRKTMQQHQYIDSKMAVQTSKSSIGAHKI